ncbi:probable RNA 2'-phosphotransferase [Culex quinquefasciatus]|uniref:probable RNA 2'-phosphotransferase n=1 Tax=Culex quinquefasciatus TaxID=7176 RepID=UPI0018E39A99|nr:probable RNA 2'-phosphotransferase [Culex quinquefasciatus]XP_038105418.1 probable RNA 2'-phosphotransferase [Culex quinquefasciatus]
MSNHKIPLIPNEKIYFQNQRPTGQRRSHNHHRSSDGSLTSHKFSWLLRHSAAVAQHMDPDGFVGFDVLLSQLKKPGCSATKERMLEFVATDQKGRFEVRGEEVRAVNGHSVHFCDNYEVVQDPPEFLYHATNNHAVPLIMGGALKRMGRHYIHMHGAPPPKTSVRYRILRIRPPRGHVFYRTKNGYFLCREDIPAEFIEVLN